MPKIYPDNKGLNEKMENYDEITRELCTRTSWVDAGIAYKQLVKV